MRRLRIGFLLPHYSRRSTSCMPMVVRTVAEAGAIVDVILPAEGAINLSRVRVEHDLYVLRKMSGLALSLAGALHQQGAAIVNPYPASAALRDKIIASRVLQAAGVPTPDRKSTRLNSSHRCISYDVFCFKKTHRIHNR